MSAALLAFALALDSGKGYVEPKALQMGFRECLEREANRKKVWLLPGAGRVRCALIIREGLV